MIYAEGRGQLTDAGEPGIYLIVFDADKTAECDTSSLSKLGLR